MALMTVTAATERQQGALAVACAQDGAFGPCLCEGAIPNNFINGSRPVPSRPRSRTGPPIWICGDCHLGNLGPLADAGHKVEIQIRDLDQTIIGNPALDLIRLGLSLESAARSSDLPGVTTAKMVEALIDGYVRALTPETDDDPVEPTVVRTVRRQGEGETLAPSGTRTGSAMSSPKSGAVRPNARFGKLTLAREENAPSQQTR